MPHGIFSMVVVAVVSWLSQLSGEDGKLRLLVATATVWSVVRQSRDVF
jgi:hypothetical protein